MVSGNVKEKYLMLAEWEMGKGKHYGKSCVSLDSALPQECTLVLVNPGHMIDSVFVY